MNAITMKARRRIHPSRSSYCCCPRVQARQAPLLCLQQHTDKPTWRTWSAPIPGGRSLPPRAVAALPPIQWQAPRRLLHLPSRRRPLLLMILLPSAVHSMPAGRRRPPIDRGTPAPAAPAACQTPFVPWMAVDAMCFVVWLGRQSVNGVVWIDKTAGWMDGQAEVEAPVRVAIVRGFVKNTKRKGGASLFFRFFLSLFLRGSF